jgi:tetratricopeptide (TPR) repeat protein
MSSTAFCYLARAHELVVLWRPLARRQPACMIPSSVPEAIHSGGLFRARTDARWWPRAANVATMRSATRLNSIEELWGAGQQHSALAALAQHLLKDPEDATAWSLRGLYLLDLRPPDREAALFALERSIALGPTYPAAYNAGNALMDLGRLPEALDRYDLSIACFDGYPQAWVNQGIVLHRLTRTPEALASFARALAIDATFLPALRCKAIALEASAEKEESEATYARMVELHPDNDAILSEYGRALSRLPKDNHMELHPHGREWKAVETLNLVIERNPSDVAAWLAKAEVLYRSMHANVCFRTSPLEYVSGPLRSGSFAGDLESLLEAAKARFGEHSGFKRYQAELDAFRSGS